MPVQGEFFQNPGSAGGFYSYQIEHSMRFDEADSTYLTRTPSSAGNSDKWSLSWWLKIGKTNSQLGGSSYYSTWWTAGSNNDAFLTAYTTEDHIYYQVNNKYEYYSNMVRDITGWYHFLFVYDINNGTSANKKRFYLNGVELTPESELSPTGSGSTNSTDQHWIGRTSGGGANYYADGYLADVVMIDGSALTPSDITETKNGVLIPKDPSSLTFGTNGFHLKFQDANALGDDSSGNNNDWTVFNAGPDHQVLDSPTFGS
jgi:hypothetical protein